MPRSDRIALTLVCGYLGAGKTTWLRHALHAGRDLPQGRDTDARRTDAQASDFLANAPSAQVLVLVNEAAERPVDDLLLGTAGAVQVLAGGCACCDGKADLIAALRALADRHSRGCAPRHVILETSGLADPGPILAAIRDDPVLVAHLAVRETVVLVDALHGLASLLADPLGQAQIELADRLILTKTALAGAGDLGRLAATLQQLNPVARIEAAERGVPVALPDLPRCAPQPLPSRGAPRPPIRAEHVDLGPGTDWTALALWLSALLHARGQDLVRVKGTVRTPAGRLLIQAVRRVVQPPEILPDDDAAADDFLVFLGHGTDPGQLGRALGRFLHAADPA